MATCNDNSTSGDFQKSLKERHLQHSISTGSHQQGYDYEFIPLLDSKYECPICLLCQREPTQTTCGHRFCRDCILTWLRTESQRCPEDNSPITEADVFPDNFAKREILCLKVRCSNAKNGCTTVVDLSHMEEHLVTCDFRTVSCPSGCPMLLLHVDIDEHVAKECLHRIIECSLCHANFPLNRQQEHFETCSMVSMPCQFCQMNLPRQDHERHIHECPNALVRCPFTDVGCDVAVSRAQMEEHLNSNTHRHVRMLNLAHSHLRMFVQKMAVVVSEMQQKWPPPWSMLPRRDSIQSGDADNIHMDQLSIQDANNARPNSLPSPSVVADRRSSPGASAAAAGVAASIASSVPTERPLLLSSAEGLMKELFQRNVQLEQRHREQELKMVTLRQQVAECETQVTLLMERIGSMTESRFCDGIYMWKLENFSRLVQEARTVGHSRLVHSPGFYTSPFGYRACLRLSIVTKELVQSSNTNGMKFVSLFVHLMQSEYDSSLPWPFEGVIAFAILDTSEQRHHIVEKMAAKPGLLAFQRPTTERNPKGFGYLEFVALDTLLAAGSRYLRDDCLLVKAAIRATQNPF